MREQEVVNAEDRAIEEWLKTISLGQDINKAWITGLVTEEFRYNHRSGNDKDYYYTMVEIKRRSDTVDIIKVIVPANLLDSNGHYKGLYINAKGEIHSYNNRETNHVEVYFMAHEADFYTEEEIGCLANINVAFLAGNICRTPVYRLTPMGRRITDLILRVGVFGRFNNYIPCITWGSVADEVSKLEKRDSIAVIGRLQSREYVKVYSDDQKETKTTYELSVSKLLDIKYTTSREK